jgi:hypothetical protein
MADDREGLALAEECHGCRILNAAPADEEEISRAISGG